MKPADGSPRHPNGRRERPARIENQCPVCSGCKDLRNGARNWLPRFLGKHPGSQCWFRVSLGHPIVDSNRERRIGHRSGKEGQQVYRTMFMVNGLLASLADRGISISCNVALEEPVPFPARFLARFVNAPLRPKVCNWPRLRHFPFSPSAHESGLCSQFCAPASFTKGRFSGSPRGRAELVNTSAQSTNPKGNDLKHRQRHPVMRSRGAPRPRVDPAEDHRRSQTRFIPQHRRIAGNRDIRPRCRPAFVSSRQSYPSPLDPDIFDLLQRLERAEEDYDAVQSVLQQASSFAPGTRGFTGCRRTGR